MLGFADCMRLKVNRVTQIWKFLNHIPSQNNIRHQISKGHIPIESLADSLFECQSYVCAVTSSLGDLTRFIVFRIRIGHGPAKVTDIK